MNEEKKKKKPWIFHHKISNPFPRTIEKSTIDNQNSPKMPPFCNINPKNPYSNNPKRHIFAVSKPKIHTQIHISKGEKKFRNL